MKSIRRIHAGLGVLFAPCIVLFALSGMFQMLGCHEGEGDSKPSSLIVRMAQLHMHQTAEMPRRRPARPQPVAAPTAEAGTALGSAQAARAETPRSPQQRAEPPFPPLRAFFLVMCLALISSSILGVWIAFTSKRDQKLHVGLLVAGFVLPAVLLLV